MWSKKKTMLIIFYCEIISNILPKKKLFTVNLFRWRETQAK